MFFVPPSGYSPEYSNIGGCGDTRAPGRGKTCAAQGGIGMYCMVIQKVDGEADDQDLKALQLSLGTRCNDLRLRGGIIRGKLLSPELAHHAVLSLTRHHRYTQATNPWKIAIAARPSVAEEDLWLEAYQLARA